MHAVKQDIGILYFNLGQGNVLKIKIERRIIQKLDIITIKGIILLILVIEIGKDPEINSEADADRDNDKETEIARNNPKNKLINNSRKGIKEEAPHREVLLAHNIHDRSIFY